MNAAEGDRNEFRMARGFTAEWVLASFIAVLCGDGWLVGAAPNMEFARADYVVGAQDSSTNDLFSDSVDAARARASVGCCSDTEHGLRKTQFVRSSLLSSR